MEQEAVGRRKTRLKMSLSNLMEFEKEGNVVLGNPKNTTGKAEDFALEDPFAEGLKNA